jgi:hypothetical protein
MVWYPPPLSRACEESQMDNLLSKESRGVSGAGTANGIGIGRAV